MHEQDQDLRTEVTELRAEVTELRAYVQALLTALTVDLPPLEPARPNLRVIRGTGS